MVRPWITREHDSEEMRCALTEKARIGISASCRLSHIPFAFTKAHCISLDLYVNSVSFHFRIEKMPVRKPPESGCKSRDVFFFDSCLLSLGSHEISFPAFGDDTSWRHVEAPLVNELKTETMQGMHAMGSDSIQNFNLTNFGSFCKAICSISETYVGF